jgi:hypothetical protein
LHRSTLILAHHPTPDAVTAEAFVLKTNDCPKCAPYLRHHLLELSVLFERAIKPAIEQVNLAVFIVRVLAYTWQIPLPKAVSVGLGSTSTAID